MKNKIFRISPALLFLSLLLIGLASCQKESVAPENTSDARLEELAAKFDKDMPDAEFAELYQLVDEKMREQTSASPTPQASYLSDREYEITYTNQVRIELGGAVYYEDRDVVEGGTTVGGIYLPPSVFEQLDGSAPHHIRLRIRSNPLDWVQGLFGLRQVIMTVVDQGNAVYYGLYNLSSREYLFLNVAGDGGNVGNTACGAIGLGRVYGKAYAPYSALTQGEVGYGIIAGCSPVLIGASIAFIYSGAELP